MVVRIISGGSTRRDGKLGKSGELEGPLLPGRRNAQSIRKNAMPRQLFSPAPPSSEFPAHQIKSRTAGSDPSFAFNWSSVALAAIVASAAITLYMMFIPRGLGIKEMDIGITVGQAVGEEGSVPAFLARVAWHVVNGLIYLVPYAAILLFLGRQSNVGTGVVFGVFLWLVGPMLLVPVVLNLYPAVASGELTHPGVFMLNLGQGLKPAAIDLGAHLTHGILAGIIYKHRCG
jgi:hypothetical protein